MSQLFATPSLELVLIVGRAIALLTGLMVFAWAFRHWRRASIRDTQRVFEQLDLVRSELLIMREAIHQAGHRGEAPAMAAPTARSLPRAMGYEPRVPATATVGAVSSAAKGYEFAARMARNGASKEELIRNCGVTSHEAELLVKLHGFRHERPAAEPSAPASATSTAARQPLAAADVNERTTRSTPRAPQTPPQRSRLVAVG